CGSEQVPTSADVRFGSKADIGEGATNVRFTPKSGHWNSLAGCPLCAKSGHEGTLFDDLVGNAEQVRRYRGAKRMPSADVQSLGGHRHRNARPGWARHRLPPLLEAEVACDHVGGIIPRAAGDRPPGVAASAAQVQSFNRRAVAAQVRSRPIAAKLR